MNIKILILFKIQYYQKFKEKSNIMVVGDDAQSIYSFRGEKC